MLYNEFKIIKKYFNKIKTKDNVIKGIGDDCAIVKIPNGQIISISTDTLVEGIHFLRNISPIDLGYKAIAVNLSDLAAMGSKPKWLTLSLTIPKINTTWLKDFSQSLLKTVNKYDMQLIGGDTTQGPLSITISVFGYNFKKQILFRHGAKIGDLIYVTGTLGASAAGLAILQKKIILRKKNICKFLIKKHLHPYPRIPQGIALRKIAHSAIDISDGLLVDLRHILYESQCGADINLNKIPVSNILKKNFYPKTWLDWALNGGEDYELCFTVPEFKKNILKKTLNKIKVPYTCIGRITKYKNKFNIFKNGKKIKYTINGYDHFKKNKN